MNRSGSALIVAVVTVLASVVVLFTTERLLLVLAVFVLGGIAVGLALLGGREAGDRRTETRLRRELLQAQHRLRELEDQVRSSTASPERPTAVAQAETALADSRAEVERARAQLAGTERLVAEAEDRARAADVRAQTAEERARMATAAARERQRSLEASLAESRAEAGRLGEELERLRVTAARPLGQAGEVPAPVARAEATLEPVVSPPPGSPSPAAAAVPLAGPSEVTSEAAGGAAIVAGPAGPAVPAEDTLPPQGEASGTLLLVDDDTDFLAGAARILRRGGHHVLEASDGHAALEQVQRYAGRIDLLITDMVMPGMNGRQLANRFTTLRPGSRVLYVSGYVDEATAREAIAGEDADFLAKPFEAEALMRKVAGMLAPA